MDLGMKFVIIVLIAGLLLSACQPAKQTLKIGAVFNLTGDQSAFDHSSLRGAKLAVKLLNADGGIKGRQLKLIVCDGKSSPEATKAAVLSLVKKHKVRLILGMSDPELIKLAASIAAQSQIPFITPGASSALLTQEIETSLFQICNPDNVQAAALADFAYDRGLNYTCVLLTDSAMEQAASLSRYFREAYTNKGGWVIRDEPFTGKSIDTHAIASRIKTGTVQPAMIFLATNAELAPGIISNLRREGIKAPIYGGDCFDTQVLLQSTILDSAKVVYATHAYLEPDTVSPRALDFVDAYKKEYQVNPENACTALGFDAINFIAEALKAAKGLKYSQLLAALSEAKLPDGVTGSISYKSEQRYPIKPVAMIGITTGKRVELGEMHPSRIPKP